MKITVYTAAIHYRHGTTVQLANTEAERAEKLYAYAKEYWDELETDRTIESFGSDHAAAVEFYFEKHGDNEYTDEGKQEFDVHPSSFLNSTERDMLKAAIDDALDSCYEETRWAKIREAELKALVEKLGL